MDNVNSFRYSDPTDLFDKLGRQVTKDEVKPWKYFKNRNEIIVALFTDGKGYRVFALIDDAMCRCIEKWLGVPPQRFYVFKESDYPAVNEGYMTLEMEKDDEVCEK